MSDDNKSILRMVWERFVSKTVDWAAVGVLGTLMIVMFDPVKERALAIWNTPEALERIANKVDELVTGLADARDDIEALRRPDEVFEVSTINSGAVDGYCTERAACVLSIKVRRNLESLPCDIVPGSSRWGFVNPRSDAFIVAERLGGSPPRNIDTSWTTIEAILRTPTGLEPGADLQFEVAYTDCPGMMPGDDPVTYSSPRIPVEIRRD